MHKLFKKYKHDLKTIASYGKIFEQMDDQSLQSKSLELRQRVIDGASLDSVKYEAFALVREGSRRVLGLFPYDEQVLAGLVIHEGCIVEAETGFGKTLTATMPVYLNALSGKGVHVITVNEYLSERDGTDMGELYEWLGLSVGINKAQSDNDYKKDAYSKDITFTTNSEVGFDYLRDNIAQNASDRVMRGFHFAVIDEADSVLIDEAKTPLIISSQPSHTTTMWFNRADRFVKTLAENEYDVDLPTNSVTLTNDGLKRVDEWFGIPNLYDDEHVALAHYIGNALQANKILMRDKDYIVRDDKVELVDSFTGRVMDGRRYSDGLHQAIEAKEFVEIQKESYVSATITYQNFFRLYSKLSGMTGTADTEKEELREIYNLDVVVVPSHHKRIRVDKTDILYPTLDMKYKAILDDIVDAHSKGQPVLLGTKSVETSMYLSELLTQRELKHEVLNAKNHAREADIIANAGQYGAITIATNMAGRGTDIKLGQGVAEVGGLYVIGSERHESRRIDNQLRGRSGRQGDPGKSQFFLSLEDDLLKRFGSERLREYLIKNAERDEPIKSRMIVKQVESAQKRVEGNNYDSRKQVLEYDDIISEQRNRIYAIRDKVLSTDGDLRDYFYTMARYVFDDIVAREGKIKAPDVLFDMGVPISSNKDLEAMYGHLCREIDMKFSMVDESELVAYQQSLLLGFIDKEWMQHISDLDQLKRSISLRSYSQTNPVVAFLEESMVLYDNMLLAIRYNVISYLLQ